MARNTCTRCLSEVRAEARFCAKCGASLASEAEQSDTDRRLAYAKWLANHTLYADAVEQLLPVRDQLADSITGGHILCARAVELIAEGQVLGALDLCHLVPQLASRDAGFRVVFGKVLFILLPLITLTPAVALPRQTVRYTTWIDNFAPLDALRIEGPQIAFHELEVVCNHIQRLSEQESTLNVLHGVAVFSEAVATCIEHQIVNAIQDGVGRLGSSSCQIGNATIAFDESVSMEKMRTVADIAWTQAIYTWAAITQNDHYWHTWRRDHSNSVKCDQPDSSPGPILVQRLRESEAIS